MVAEAALNLACVGARPLALVDNLNFGNPEHPEVMWQLSEAIDGMAEACLALDLPVVGGNVSLYNESGGRDIDPTPVVGRGRADRRPRAPAAGRGPGRRRRTCSCCGAFTATGLAARGRRLAAGSRWAADRGHRGGVLPALDLEAHARLCDLVRGLVDADLLAGVHDVSDGGLAVALAEMAIASGVGFHVSTLGGHAALFSEAPSRVVVCLTVDALAAVTERTMQAGLTLVPLGPAGGDRLVVEGLVDLALDDTLGVWRGRLRRKMAGAVG